MLGIFFQHCSRKPAPTEPNLAPVSQEVARCNTQRRSQWGLRTCPSYGSTWGTTVEVATYHDITLNHYIICYVTGSNKLWYAIVCHNILPKSTTRHFKDIAGPVGPVGPVGAGCSGGGSSEANGECGWRTSKSCYGRMTTVLWQAPPSVTFQQPVDIVAGGILSLTNWFQILGG